MKRKLYELGDRFEFIAHRGKEKISVHISQTEMAANTPTCLVNLIHYRLGASIKILENAARAEINRLQSLAEAQYAEAREKRTIDARI